MIYLIIAVAFLAGSVLPWLIFRCLRRRCPHSRAEWLSRLLGEVPWAGRSFATLGEGHGYSDVIFVSRHDIAEGGLTCPACRSSVAAHGDFTNVRRALVNGRENEVIRCTGKMADPVRGERDCGMWLVASPTTEHGDHLDKTTGEVITHGAFPAEMFRFKRVSAREVLAQQWGMDVREREATPAEAEYQRDAANDFAPHDLLGAPAVDTKAPTERLPASIRPLKDRP